MKATLLWLWFAAIQIVSLVLAIAGIPVCAWLAWRGVWACSTSGVWHWGHDWAWLWDNEEDGICPRWYRDNNYHKRSLELCAFIWTAFRNPVNNLRFVRGVSGLNRPYFLYIYKRWYCHMGWRQDTGWPVLSLGAN